MPYQPNLNFKLSNGTDLGNLGWITKEYLMTVYPQIANQLITPELWTWGGNSFGQLGNNTSGTNILTPITTFAGGANWKQVSSAGGVASGHTAAIKTDGTLWTWGANLGGGIGDNTATQRNTPVTTFAGGTNWKQVSCGREFTAAIKTDGTLWTWGLNNEVGLAGMLGNNTSTNRSTPVTTFAGGTNWKQVACGYRHVAAIKTDGTLWTWGNNSNGQLGNNTSGTNILTPITTFAGGANWKQVSANSSSTAAIKTDGTLWTWGDNYNGQLGDNTTTTRSIPVTTFAGGTNWKQVKTGYFTSAIKTDGTLWTWGRNSYGQLGSGSSSQDFAGQISVPMIITNGGNDWAQLDPSSPSIFTLSGTAAIKTDGTLWTWGGNSFGQLGDNTLNDNSIPSTTFAGGANWKQVSSAGGVASGHKAAIKTDGTLWTWGNNYSGRLGDNTTTTRSIPVTTFAGGTNWKQVACGGSHTTAIKTDGTLWTWGSNNNGQLGDNTSTQRFTPVTTFAGGTNWKEVSCGEMYTHAIKTDGTLWGWGLNSSGQLGNNTTTQINTPVTTFAGGTNWKQVSCGFSHTAAIKTDGTLWTWGENSYAQLGDNTTTDRSTPVTTFAGGTNWKQVSSTQITTAAIKTDGTLWTWGWHYNFGLGNGEFYSIVTLVDISGTMSTGDNVFYATNLNGLSMSNLQYYSYASNDQGDPDMDNLFWMSFPYEVSDIDTVNNTITFGTGQYDGPGFTGIVSLNKSDDVIRSTPVTTFAGGTNWNQVSAGWDVTSAIKTDGTLWVWGYHNNIGVYPDICITPRTIFGRGTNWKQVAGGFDHTAAVKTDGTLWTWGRNNSGQLGDSTTIDKYIPVTTSLGRTDWKQVACGDTFMVAIRTSDDLQGI